MRTFAFKSRYLSLDVAVSAPPKVAEWVRRRRPPSAGPEAAPADPSTAAEPALGGLVVADEVPELHVERRDPYETVEPFRKLAPRSVGDDTPLHRQVSEVIWYHTIELPGGVVTPGLDDHRPLVPHYGIPQRLDGQRVLDIASWDGFWAFEFERRGAEVTSLDIPRVSACDFPPPARDALLEEGLDRESTLGFRIAHDALGSKVERVEASVYDLGSTGLEPFDLVHAGDFLLHLERPTEALRQIRNVTGGRAILADAFDPELGAGRRAHYIGGWPGVVWWIPSLDALAQMVIDAGFADVRVHSVYSLAEYDQPAGPWRACLVATP